jgi:hypothetical protein
MRIFIVCPPEIGETYLRLERRGVSNSEERACPELDSHRACLAEVEHDERGEPNKGPMSSTALPAGDVSLFILPVSVLNALFETNFPPFFVCDCG